MGIYINRGNGSFASAVNSQIYVDKTGLLEYTNSVLDTEQRFICFSRPRRFGKSVTAGMLAAYYDRSCDSHALFQNLKIAKSPAYQKHLNQYDVIQLDITTFHRQDENSTEMLRRMNLEIVTELRETYENTLPEVEDYLPSALATIHKKTGRSFIVIIDEWDAIFRESKSDVKAQKAYVEWLCDMFKSETAKGFIKLAYLTGILPIKKYNSESALNNFDEFTMTSPAMLAEYVGFTESEVQSLCKQYQMNFDEAARWYDGYSFRTEQHVYNPNSIVKAMLRREYSNYWTQTVAYESLKTYILMNFDGLKDAIIQMLAGGQCKIRVDSFENDMTSFKQKDDVLTILIHLGYLTYNSLTREVRIPNEEVRAAFSEVILDTDWTPVIHAIQESDALLESTWQKDSTAVAQKLDIVHMENTSILSYNDENALSCVITLAYFNARNDYTLIREFPTGNGYADVVFLPRRHSDKPAMVVELKYNKSPDSAIAQIKNKRYPKALEDYQGNLLLVGINYDKEKKAHSCIIEAWNKNSHR